MSKASKLIADAIIGADYILVEVNGKMYPVEQPVAKRLAGAVSCISNLDMQDAGTLKDMLLSAKDCSAYARALSWFIKGNEELTDELMEGKYAELVDALAAIFDMISIAPFVKAASLTKNASLLVAKPK
jgi:hypothetical protein